MESKISKLKGIHCEFRHCITYTENGSEVAVQTFLDSFGRTVYGTLGTRGFSRVRREFSVLAEGRHNFGRRPKPRAATALERSLAPRLCLRWLATCFAALLRNGFKSYVALFTTPTFKAERRSAERELASSNPGRTNTQGLKNNWGESAVFVMTSAND